MEFSLCMIVKNEEKILKRCLDSVADLMDEIIIVDTGSTDRTKEIAAEYTDKIYDFTWIDDFSAARNFACQKATKDYIYTADADEVIDEENRERFRVLKEALMPEVEIVQMYYVQDLKKSTTDNYEREYRVKLFKRLRNFTWIDPVHETLRLDPVVFDSDIEILHLPENVEHASRDLRIFRKLGKNKQALSKKLHHMYAAELYKAGENTDFVEAIEQFEETLTRDVDIDMTREALAVLTRAYLIKGDEVKMFANAIKDIGAGGSSEVCFCLGQYYEEKQEWNEAVMWYQNAAYSSESILDIRTSTQAAERIEMCMERCNI